jgi:F-type H+/Na+-transporting ATPase subunit beta
MEQFTGLPGRTVALDDTLDGCGRILAGECSDRPMIGPVSEARPA